jgi:hypothetical protein
MFCHMCWRFPQTDTNTVFNPVTRRQKRYLLNLIKLANETRGSCIDVTYFISYSQCMGEFRQKNAKLPMMIRTGSLALN